MPFFFFRHIATLMMTSERERELSDCAREGGWYLFLVLTNKHFFFFLVICIGTVSKRAREELIKAYGLKVRLDKEKVYNRSTRKPVTLLLDDDC